MVVNWNGGHLTLDCLRSLETSDWTKRHVIVVDNGSTDGSTTMIAEAFPDVELIANSSNLGFAEGNNVGIRRSLARGAQLILILNNDTIVDSRALTALVSALETCPEVGAVSPIIHYFNPADRIWFAGADFDPRRGYPGRVRGYQEENRGQFSGIQEADRLTGAAMMVRRQAIEQTGMFDPSLFFLYEDVDWSLRMVRAGLRLYVVPDARVWHRVAASQGHEHSPASTYYGLRNQLLVSRRHAPLGRCRSIQRTLGALLVHVVRLRRTHQRWRSARALVAGFRDALCGRAGPWRSSSEQRRGDSGC